MIDETTIDPTMPDPPYVDNIPDEAPAPTDPQIEDAPKNDEAPE